MGIAKYGLESFIDEFTRLQQGKPINKSKSVSPDEETKDVPTDKSEQQESSESVTPSIASNNSNANNTSSAILNDNTMVTGIDLTTYIQSLNIGFPGSSSALFSDNVVGDTSLKTDRNSRMSITAIPLQDSVDSSNNGKDKIFHHVLDTLASPWIETSRSEVEPRYHTPKSFTNITGILGTVGQPRFNEVSNIEQNKVSLLQDETLFFLFYKHPTSAIQELTYIELRKRNWRYHKLLKIWLTKDPIMEPLVQPDGLSERGKYIFFDSSKWEKCQKDFILHYSAIM